MNKCFNRRNFLKAAGLSAASVLVPGCSNISSAGKQKVQKPNIIYILADDLGYAEVGCYGQKKIKTPFIDQLAANGMKFTQHYSGSAVCAPTRCMLLTGKHSGHAYIRGNDEMSERGDTWHDRSLEGQRPLLEDTYTIGHMLQKVGYKTCCVGKWGLGWYGSTGDPNKQGFDHFYGYICQREAHNYYPDHLWRNGKKVPLKNEYYFPHEKLPKDKDPNESKSYEKYRGNDYAPDKMANEVMTWLKENKNEPFFLYWATPVPHVSLQVPEDSLEQYKDAFEDKPYLGDKGYLPNQTPRATYAAMVTRMDSEIGRMMKLLKELGVAENTIIIFSSDNGPTFNGGTDSEYFESNGPFNGLKCSLKEGGIRAPMIASWPGRIKPGTTSDLISGQWDVMATLADITGAKASADTDGISFLPTLLGQDEKQVQHDYLYWEYGNQQAVRIGKWKGYRNNLKKKPDTPFKLFDLSSDIGETKDVAKDNPEIIKRMLDISKLRVPSPIKAWNF